MKKKKNIQAPPAPPKIRIVGEAIEPPETKGTRRADSYLDSPILYCLDKAEEGKAIFVLLAILSMPVSILSNAMQAIGGITFAIYYVISTYKKQ